MTHKPTIGGEGHKAFRSATHNCQEANPAILQATPPPLPPPPRHPTTHPPSLPLSTSYAVCKSFM